MATKKSTLTKDKIVSMFMQDTLENNEKPKSVYNFAKANGITEAEFYTLFGGLEGVEKEIFNQFIEKTKELLNKDKDYEYYDMKSKMLSFYFTFFELLAANRSYVVLSLKGDKNPLQGLMQLSSLRNGFKDFVSEIISDEYRLKQEKFQQIQEKAIQESAWFQLIMTLKFWLDDTSASFEKTDLFIEKSVKASFELMNTAPLESLMDFGKFLFKEKIQHN
jgi:Tetracyclin repressor-like, C-terminal domain